MRDSRLTKSRPAARSFWPLIVLSCLLMGCASDSLRRFQHIPSGAVGYPGVSRYFGPFAYHRLYSILPGSAPLTCPQRYEVVETARPIVTVQSCRANSGADMRQIANVIAQSFTFLEQASEGRLKVCSVKLALVDLDVGVQASDTQSLKSACARLKMLGRWEPALVGEQRANVTRSIVANAAHEAYHITLRREGPRTRDRVVEETEADIVGHCAALKTLGPATSKSAIEEVMRPEEMDVDRFYHDTLAGDRAAEAAIRSGMVAAIAASAPAGTARILLTACAKILEKPRS